MRIFDPLPGLLHIVWIDVDAHEVPARFDCCYTRSPQAAKGVQDHLALESVQLDAPVGELDGEGGWMSDPARRGGRELPYAPCELQELLFRRRGLSLYSFPREPFLGEDEDVLMRVPEGRVGGG